MKHFITYYTHYRLIFDLLPAIYLQGVRSMPSVSKFVLENILSYPHPLPTFNLSFLLYDPGTFFSTFMLYAQIESYASIKFRTYK